MTNSSHLSGSSYKGSLRKRASERLLRLYISTGLIVGATLLGTIGYVLIEDYPLLDAFYMTIITLASVGYGEIHPLSQAGRVFTVFLIVTNLGIFAYALSVTSLFVIEGGFGKLWRDFSMEKKIKNLHKHTIICGYGRYGREISAYFTRHGIPFVVVEVQEEALDLLEKQPNILVVSGDATHDEVLEEAGILRARALISTLPEDADNVYVTLTARQMNPQLRIISRSVSSKSDVKLRLAGANEVINPEQIGSFYMATLVGKPDLISLFHVLSNEASANISFEEIKFVPQNDGKSYSIKDLNIRGNTGISIIGVKMPDGSFLVNPSPDMVLLSDMYLFVLGNHEQIAKFKLLCKESGSNTLGFVE